MSHRVTVIQHRFVYIKGYSGFGLFGLFGLLVGLVYIVDCLSVKVF